MDCLQAPDKATDFLILILYIFSYLTLGCLEVESVDRYVMPCTSISTKTAVPREMEQLRDIILQYIVCTGTIGWNDCVCILTWFIGSQSFYLFSPAPVLPMTKQRFTQKQSLSSITSRKISNTCMLHVMYH